MWKRSQGFDVIEYKGINTTPRWIPHSLNKVPEMIWIKNRTDTVGWFIGHSAMNNGTNPFAGGHYAQFDTGAPTSDTDVWNGNPTSTHFNVGDYSGVNGSNKEILAMLFASVDGISKCGSYNGSGSTQTITTGFQPRLLIVKCLTDGDSNTNWLILDTTRGLADGNDQVATLNTSNAQGSADFFDVLSTGFEVNGSAKANNDSSEKYLYYAHA